jgi:DNA-directed RNA polymerase subunit RPC12/RpoP
MTKPIGPVLWLMASHPHRCAECGEKIWTGERFAHYVEILAVDCYGRHARMPHDYCAECGHLLEDSLTTTEAVK